MGKFKGFTCDSCGKVLDEATRTRKRTSFEGPAADGSYIEDLCEECVVIPEGVNFRQTKRRANGQVDASASNAASPHVVTDSEINRMEQPIVSTGYPQ